MYEIIIYISEFDKLFVRLSFLDHIVSAHLKERDVQAKRMTIRELSEIKAKS